MSSASKPISIEEATRLALDYVKNVQSTSHQKAWLVQLGVPPMVTRAGGTLTHVYIRDGGGGEPRKLSRGKYLVRAVDELEAYMQVCKLEGAHDE